MVQVFDMFNNPEKPQIILTKPTGEQIFEIGQYDNLNIDDKYNDVSQISFTVYRESVEDYDEIKGKKYVEISTYGIYIIDDVVDTSDGLIESKAVLCKSVDFELSYKHITLEADIYELYDPISPDGTLLKRIIDLVPSWSIGTVDSAVASKSRYFDVEDKTLLQFLYSDLEDAYQAVAEIDYTTRTINIVALENVGSNSDIYISHDNLAEVIEVSELSNEIVTNLTVFGGNDLSIVGVNPTGTNTIANLDYFKTTEWMSQDLIDALDNYQTLYDANETIYSGLLVDLKNANQDLLNLQTDLSLLNNELTALETLQRERIQASVPIGTLYNDIVLKQAEITSKENEISNKEAEVVSITNSLISIVNTLSIENNFTSQQIEDLDKITIEYTYQNEAYIITDSMTPVDIQEQEELLFQDAQEILSRLSQPRFSFKISVVDFLKVQDYEVFTEQFELATIINIELADGSVIETRLISYQHDWDNNNLSLEFTSKYRTNDSTYLYNELYKKSVDAGVSTSFSKSSWYDYTRNDKDEVTTFINSSLNTTVNNLISTTNQDMIIDSNGLRGRQSDGSGGYLPEQMWMTNNMLSFSDDGFQTARLALGKIQDSQYGEVYGLVGDVLVGRILAGNNIRIENTTNSFVLDENGAVLTDASFTLDTTDGKGRIILDPDQGIRVQGNTTGTLQDKFYVDTNGNVIFSGTLSGVDGNFSGTISASNIIGSNISASVITGGDIISSTLTSADIVGGDISGVNISGTNILAGTMDVGTNLSFVSNVNGGQIELLNNFIFATASSLQISANFDMDIFTTGDLAINSDEVYIGNKTSDNIVVTQGDLDDYVENVLGLFGIDTNKTGSTVTVGVDRDEVVTSLSNQDIRLQYLSGNNTVEVRVNGTFRGSIQLV